MEMERGVRRKKERGRNDHKKNIRGGGEYIAERRRNEGNDESGWMNGERMERLING